MSDLGAIVKTAAEDMAEGGEKAGAAIAEHFEGIGSELENSVTRYRGAESDIEHSFTSITEDGAQDAERATGQVGKDATQSADPARAGGDPLSGDGGVEDDFSGGDEGGHDSEGSENSEGASDPVDVVSGQMLTSIVDVELPGALPLRLRRAYASGYRHGALFGTGWSSTLDQRLVIDADGVHFVGDDAQVLNYGVPTQPGQRVLPAAGARWPLTWDRRFDVIEVHDPYTGLVRKFPSARRDASGREVRDLARIEDRNGNWIAFMRDADGVPTEVVHSGGYRISVDSALSGGEFRITGIRLASGVPAGQGLLDYGYDRRGRLAEISDSSGIPFTFEYDDADRITAWVDRLGYRYEYHYDHAGRVARGIGPEGFLSADFDYNPGERVTRVTNGLGEVTAYHYDEHRHITRIVDARGAEMRFEHDRYGRETACTDALGNTARYAYDERGDLVRIEQPDGTQITARYNASHQPIEVIDQAGARWNYAFDARGNLTTRVDPTGARSAYSYDDRGRLTSSTDATGNTTQYETNAAGVMTALIDPLGAISRTARDAYGRAVELTDPLGSITRFGFTPEGRALWRELPGGIREQWAYDAEGNQVRHVDPAGGATVYEYGPLALRTGEIRPDGTRYGFTYDAERNLREVRDPAGLVWHYEYAPGGLLIREADFNDRVTVYGHDPVGRLAERTNAAGQRVTLSRDPCGRVTERRLEEHDTIRYAYDPVGRLTLAASGETVLECAYDSVGRITAETVDGRTTSYRYDPDGRVLQRTTPSGASSLWTFDANGQPATLTAEAGTLSFAYDAVGRETSRVIGSGAAVSQAWDGNHRLTGQALWARQAPTDPGTEGGYTPLIQRGYEYRPDGYPLAITHSGGEAVRFHLDEFGRPTAIDSPDGREQYAFDTSGRLTAATWPSPDDTAQGERAYDGMHLVRAGRTTYAYDAQGRVVRKQRKTLSGQIKTWTFTWDADDKLTEATTPDGARWRYRYDAFGRRISKQHLSPDSKVIEELTFTWDGTRLAEQTRLVEGGRREAVTWDLEPGTGRVAAQTRSSWAEHAPQEEIDREFRAIVTDRAGTPTELVTSDGRITWQTRANLWGATDTFAAAAGEEPFPLRFPGQYHDEETGLDYNYLRYYDPEAARYLTADPLGLFPQPDEYGYTTNPLVWIDPLGLGRNKPPHYADISVYDPDNNIKYAYTLRSGNQLPGEAALGFPNATMASHTEVRGVRMHGGSPTVPIPNDPIANTMPVSPGDRIEINGTKPPCPQCRGAMNRAVRELGVSVNYNWGGNTWSATG